MKNNEGRIETLWVCPVCNGARTLLVPEDAQNSAEAHSSTPLTQAQADNNRRTVICSEFLEDAIKKLNDLETLLNLWSEQRASVRHKAAPAHNGAMATIS